LNYESKKKYVKKYQPELIFQTRDPGSLDWKQPIKKNQEAQFPTSQMLNDEIEKTNFIYIDPKQKKNNN
jgi:hypothetical protein